MERGGRSRAPRRCASSLASVEVEFRSASPLRVVEVVGAADGGGVTQPQPLHRWQVGPAKVRSVIDGLSHPLHRWQVGPDRMAITAIREGLAAMDENKDGKVRPRARYSTKVARYPLPLQVARYRGRASQGCVPSRLPPS